MEDLRLKKESESRHCIHWQGCPNYKGLYGEGGELNVVSFKAVPTRPAIYIWVFFLLF